MGVSPMPSRFVHACLRARAVAASVAVLGMLAAAAPLRAVDGDAGDLVIATSLWIVADAFVVDVYHNGVAVPDAQRKIVKDVYGSCVEKVDAEVRAGDWLVFHVVTNRLRMQTKGSRYFAVAGVGANGRIGFVSEAASGRWSAVDDPALSDEFIRDPAAMADAKAARLDKPWPGGDGLMRERVKAWTGEPVWGGEPSTWIKFVTSMPLTGPSATRPAERRRVVFVADATGTMIGLKFKLLQRQLATAIEQLAPTDQVNIVFFRGGDSDVEWVASFEPRPVAATPDNKRRANDFVQRLEVMGKGTNPLPSLTMAMQQQPREIRFFTDGEFNNIVSYDRVLAELRKLNRGKRVRIHTVAFLSEDLEAEQVLQQIAEEHGGTYRKITERDVKDGALDMP
jgi:hypothetical protein